MRGKRRLARSFRALCENSIWPGIVARRSGIDGAVRRRISQRREPRKSSKMAVFLKFLRILIPLSFFGPVLRSSLSFLAYLIPRFYGVLVFEVSAFLRSSRSLFRGSFYYIVFLLEKF